MVLKLLALLFGQWFCLERMVYRRQRFLSPLVFLPFHCECLPLIDFDDSGRSHR